jgi:hypothetical protein
LSLNQYYATCEPEDTRRLSEKINAASKIAQVTYMVLKIVVLKIETVNPNSRYSKTKNIPILDKALSVSSGSLR